MTKQEEIRSGLENLFDDCEDEHSKYLADVVLSYLHSQGVVIKVGEKGYCSLCVSSREHIGDLGWDKIKEESDV